MLATISDGTDPLPQLVEGGLLPASSCVTPVPFFNGTMVVFVDFDTNSDELQDTQWVSTVTNQLQKLRLNQYKTDCDTHHGGNDKLLDSKSRSRSGFSDAVGCYPYVLKAESCWCQISDRTAEWLYP